MKRKMGDLLGGDSLWGLKLKAHRSAERPRDMNQRLALQRGKGEASEEVKGD